jgi:hypothetical protein
LYLQQKREQTKTSKAPFLIKRAQLAFTTPCARAHMHFADGSIKVLEKSCGQKTWTKNVDKKLGQKNWKKKLDKKGRQTPKEVPHTGTPSVT